MEQSLANVHVDRRESANTIGFKRQMWKISSKKIKKESNKSGCSGIRSFLTSKLLS